MGIFITLHGVNAQDIRCGIERFSTEFLSANPDQVLEMKKDEAFYESWRKSQHGPTGGGDSIMIPVVFHVFADNANTLVPLKQCQSALNKANEDFNGRNADLATIDPEFKALASTYKFHFSLAQIDPNGNPTTGVTYHPIDSGFAKTTMDTHIAGFAWDNYKYVNIYVMNCLFSDGVYNNSGFAFYPNTSMSDKKTARIVYNYWYLGNTGSSIASGEFQSTFTHELGHFFNLYHTFNSGSCVDYDGVDDTPSSDVAGGGCGPAATHCGHHINGENYMDYNASCYKMFTKGQVDRIDAALFHASRFPLWQTSNLIATGILAPTGTSEAKNISNIHFTLRTNAIFTDADEVQLYSLFGSALPVRKNGNMISLDEINGLIIVVLKKDGGLSVKKLFVNTPQE